MGDPLTLALLALFGLVGGIGITAVGPGGVLPTIGMFLLTGLSPPGSPARPSPPTSRPARSAPPRTPGPASSASPRRGARR
ncbi:hypothetical protein [Actinomadura sp. J1-007]|uniref:hypothetical protein n=1 Tax=Actinomadura sp. J1-007 TaxID=2661913 RepID=UPI002815DBEA|nr:hypothetical protein [Actinomadura sp. J1-007]